MQVLLQANTVQLDTNSLTQIPKKNIQSPVKQQGSFVYNAIKGGFQSFKCHLCFIIFGSE